MLVQLTPDQIGKFWDFMAPAIRVSLPPNVRGSDIAQNNILESLLSGKLRAWILMKNANGKAYAIIITTFVEDDHSKERSLLIYSLFGYKEIPDELWKAGLVSIKKYCAEKDCTGIIMYTDKSSVINLGKSIGAKTSTVLRMEV